MLKDPRNLLWIVPLAALLTLPFWKPIAVDFLSPERKKTDPLPPALEAPSRQTSSEMTGVHLVQDKNGTREWTLTASRLYSMENDSDMQLEDVKALFYGSAGEQEETRIRSKKAIYNEDTKQITLQGEVVVQNDKGYEIQTESLEYLSAEKKIRTTSAVNIQGSNIEVRGNQLLYDTATGDYSLEGDVVCRVW